MRGRLALCVVLLWGGLQAPAQEAVPPDSGAAKAATGLLTIQSDVDSAFVLVDSIKVGRTPLSLRDVQPGFHRLKIVHPDMTNWLTGSLVDSIQVRPGEEKVLRYRFGKRYLILSVPSGAEVFIEDSLTGSTPYLFASQDTSVIPSITLKKTGYDSAKVDLSDARRGIQTVTLKKLWSTEQGADDPDETGVTQKHNTFPIILAGAVTVGFGAAAAYFKIRADDQNDQFLTDPGSGSRSRVQTYDTASAICLTAAEVGFVFLSYLLLTE